jgi:hypothetical protein
MKELILVTILTVLFVPVSGIAADPAVAPAGIPVMTPSGADQCGTDRNIVDKSKVTTKAEAETGGGSVQENARPQTP